jgi:hypothetical protein
MLDRMRRPFLFLALAFIVLAVLAEVGAGFLLTPKTPGRDDLQQMIARSDVPEDADVDVDDLVEVRRREEAPPGLAIRSMALLDGLVAFTIGLMALGLLLPERIHGRIQGILTLVVSFLVVVGGIVVVFATLALLLFMVGLFLAVPFGTLAYLAVFGFFDRGGAAVTLSLVMLLKLGFAICLVLAHQSFLTVKRIVLLVLTSLLANVVVSFLHGPPPIILVSITDAIAAIVVVILALLWALPMLIFSLVSLVKVLRVDRSSG